MLNPQDLLQNRSLETVPICTVWQCFCCLLWHVTQCVRVEWHEEGSRTRQLAQTEKQIAVVLMPLIPLFVRDGWRKPNKHRALRMLPFTEQEKRSLILLCTRCAAARSLQQQSWRSVSFDTHSTLPAPLDFSYLEEQVFLVIGIRRLRICRAEPNYCLPELRCPSPVAVVPLVASLPTRPCLLREQLQWSKISILFGMPTTRQQADASCVILRPRKPNTRFAKFLRELGCSRSTSAAPHIAASPRQEVALWSCVLSQCCRRMPKKFCACPFLFCSPTRCTFVTHTSQNLCRPLHLKTWGSAKIGFARFHRSSLSSHPWGGAVTSGHRSPPFAWRMKLPM